MKSMTPRNMFLELLQFSLNGRVPEQTALVVEKRRSRVALSSDGQQVLAMSVVLEHAGVCFNLEDLYGGLGEAFALCGTTLWANDPHELYLIGQGRPLVFKRNGPTEIVLKTKKPICVLWDNGMPLGFHNQSHEADLEMISRRIAMA